MKKLMIVGLVVGLFLAFGGVSIASALPGVELDTKRIEVTVDNPLYAEIRNLAPNSVLPPLTFSGGMYQNSSVKEYFDIVTNGNVNFTATITRPFRHVENPDYWLRSLVYTKFPNGGQVHPFRLEFNDKENSNWSSSQTVLLPGPGKYENMYLDIQASKYGADIHELMVGEYSTEIVLTVAAP